MPLEDFGSRLAALMARRELSQTDVAIEARTTQPTIWRLIKERGAKPSADLYVKLVSAYPELAEEVREAAS